MKVFALVPIFAVLLSSISFAQQSSCDYKVEVLVNSSEFEKQEFSWKMKATKIEGIPTSITGTADIEDSNGEIMRKYRPWVNESISKQKTSSQYTPNLKEGAYKITSRINVGCNDINEGNNVDFKIIKIIEKSKEFTNVINKNNSKNILIDAKINDTIKNEAANQIIANQTAESKALDGKEAKQLANNEEDNVIQLRNNKKEVESAANVVKKPETAYESSNEKAKGLIMIFLLILSILLNIVLIWKR